tara:strand:- start:1027 stop:1770 length:744 start_codon:yes stop_codon:yes gene_type:complete
VIKKGILKLISRRNYCLFFVVLIISGCFDFPTEWDIQLWEQKIEDSNLSIYKFDAWGGRDSNVSGLRIKDSSDGFTQEDVLKGDELSTFRAIPSKSLIQVFNTIRPENGESNSNIAISSKVFEIAGITINQETYRYNGTVSGICNLKSYYFKTFEETRDSLIFYENDSQFVNGTNFNSISIPKGNIYLISSKDNEYVERVVYHDLLIFHNLSTSKGVEICRHVKYFDPMDSIRVSEFSDYGIFKPVK